ncbi:sigma-70 family RNA polymerase sigma factor [Microbulbifer litoralis]|uniref:sigma-70 family RNA polymerase sigma factor n=1 Tax=Microbulbifer litoralis TaxID=2933965 RepID=UPI002027CD2A
MKYIDNKLDVYLDHRADLVDYVATITGCRSRAEDVVQDAFLRFVPDNGPAAAPGTSGAAYLYRIVRNLAFDLSRRSTMESRHQNEESVEWLKPREERSPEQLLLQHKRLEQLSVVLEGLPERERIAIEMHRVGGYTLAEISERLRVSTATAHRLVRRAVVHIAASVA